MLKIIKLKNFQIHKSLEIVLNSESTCIWALNNMGKSSIIRAIKLCMLASMFPSRYLTTGEQEGYIELIFVDDLGKNVTIRRTFYKTKSSFFTINNEKLESSGASRGKDLLEPLGIKFDDINLSNQIDRHYYIGKTPKEAGDELSKYIGIISERNMQIYIAKDILENKSRLKYLMDELKEVEYINSDDNKVLLQDYKKSKADFKENIIELEKISNTYNSILNVFDNYKTLGLLGVTVFNRVKRAYEDIIKNKFIIESIELLRANMNDILSTPKISKETAEYYSKYIEYVSVLKTVLNLKKLFKSRVKEFSIILLEENYLKYNKSLIVVDTLNKMKLEYTILNSYNIDIESIEQEKININNYENIINKCKYLIDVYKQLEICKANPIYKVKEIVCPECGQLVV